MKLIALVLGLVIGFLGGVWWGVNHPEQAQQLSAAEEKRFIEAQIKLTRAAKDQLDRVIASKSAPAPATPGSGILGSSPLSNAFDQGAMVRLRDQQDRQLDDLQKRYDALDHK